MTNIKYTLLEIAFNDLESSIVLFRSGFYPQSIFYSQQAVEKTIKHIGLNNGIIKQNELQNKIGHKAEIILKGLVKETKSFTQNNEDIDFEYNKLKQLILNHDLNDYKEIILEQLRDIRKTRISNVDIDDLINTMVKMIEPKFFDVLKNNNKIRANFESKKKDFEDSFPDYLKSGMILFITNLILSDYVSKVRYPIDNSFDNPALIFNEDHPLTKLLPEFHDNIRFAIKSVLKSQMIF